VDHIVEVLDFNAFSCIACCYGCCVFFETYPVMVDRDVLNHWSNGALHCLRYTFAEQSCLVHASVFLVLDWNEFVLFQLITAMQM